MRRQLTGLALSTLLLAGCASAPQAQSGGLYHAPARAYSLSLDSGAFRGAVTLTESCDKNGGTLNVWDTANRFFRIDYLKIGQHPMADVPSFASERTIDEQVLSNYLRDVLPDMPNIEDAQPMIQEFVDTGRGNAMFAVVSLKMKRSALPEGITNPRFYYGFLVFTRGDMVFVLQHRGDTYQPDNMKTVLSGLRQDMLVPGVLRPVNVEDPALQQCQ
ncbi:MAG TPA: hypothetical protein VFV15_04445 [Moraxellaceae bacterium]|nr:hypothetical protein [Moraxellaceae bacterium]